MAIKIRKQAAASVETPLPTHLQFFIDTDGLLKLKDDLGNVTDAATTGGGDSTYLDNAQYLWIEELLNTSDSPFDFNTGIVIPLVNNTMIAIRIETASALEGASQDSGVMQYSVGWGTAPTLPAAPPLSALSAPAGVTNVIGGYLGISFGLNGAGELFMRTAPIAGPAGLQIAMKVAVWVKVLPFAPSFPA